jgi:HEAT repeat protein
VRAQAARSLGAVGGEKAVDALLEAFGKEGESPEVRAALAEALGQAGDPRAVDPLMAALEDPERQVGRGVAGALVALGGPAVGPLTTVLKHKDPMMRLKAIWILGQIKDMRAVRPLIDTLDDPDERVVKHVGDSLVKITGHMREPVREYWETWWERHKDEVPSEK